MKYCTNCNSPLEDNASVCPVCQLDCSSADQARQQETAAFNLMFRMMKYERLSWFIGGGIQLGLAVLMAILLAFLVGIDPTAETMELFLDVILYLFLGIVNLVLGSRITRYMDMMDCDIRPAYDRATSVKTLVLAGIFNNVALIFAIINFATAKGNRAIIGQIIHNQIHHRGGEFR